MKSYKPNSQHILIEGHRGFGCEREDVKEQTSSAFKNAAEIRLDSVELDVWLTKDNEVIVTHGDNYLGFQYVFDENGDKTVICLPKLTYAEIQKYKCAKTNEHFLKLSEVLQILKPSKTDLNCELKHSDYAILPRIIDIIQDEKFPFDRVMFSSFHHKFRRKILEEEKKRGMERTFRFAYLTHTLEGMHGHPDLEVEKDFIWKGHDFVHADYQQLLFFEDEFNEKVKQNKEAGLRLGFWGSMDFQHLENEEYYKKAMEIGCEKIITNLPKLFLDFRLKYNNTSA